MSEDDAATTLVDAVEKRLTEIDQSFHSVGTVTDVSDNRATVDIAGGEVNLAYPDHYTPQTGDVVQVIGRTGSQFIVARLDFGGPKRDITYDDITCDDITVNGDATFNGESQFNADVHIDPFNIDVDSIFGTGGTFTGNVNANSFSSGTTTLNAIGFSGPGAAFTGNCNANSFAAGGSQMTTAGFIGAGCNFSGAALAGSFTAGSSTLSSGGLSAPGASFSGNCNANSFAAGGSQVTNAGFIGAGCNFSGAALAGSFTAGASTMSGLGVVAPGASFSGNCNAGSFSPYPSSRALKQNIRELDESPLEMVLGAPVQAWEYKPDVLPDAELPTGRRIGPMVDDLPSVAVTEGPHGPAPELGAMTNLAWAAIQELSTIVETQAAQIAALTARLDALEDLTRSEQ